MPPEETVPCVNCAAPTNGAMGGHDVKRVGMVCASCFDLAPPMDPREAFGARRSRRVGRRGAASQDPRIAQPN